jgi:hypothetical protein
VQDILISLENQLCSRPEPQARPKNGTSITPAEPSETLQPTNQSLSPTLEEETDSWFGKQPLNGGKFSDSHAKCS